jgi:tripartite-type tricarboxylate transporter receptor subunit TctC
MRLNSLIAPALSAALACFAAVPARAEYPDKPIRVFIPFAPGGVGDITFRLVTGKVSERTNMTFVIENKPGAGGVASAMAGKTAAPDGYTLAQIGNSYALGASLFKSLPFDVLKDFAPVAALAKFDVLLATRKGGDIGSVAGVLDLDKAKPGKLNFGAISAGSTQNLAAEMFKAAIGSQATVVSFKSSPELVLAIQRGEIDVGFDYLAAFASPVASGELRIIASGGPERSALTPDTPTAIEGGVAGYVASAWNGVAAPAGTPPEIVNRLNREMDAALKLPETREKLRLLGMEAVGGTPGEMGAQLRSDMARWKVVIDRLGIAQ